MAAEATNETVTAPADYLPHPGSDLYYAQRFAPPTLRPLLALIEALRGEIARVPATCSSPDIAMTKLAWWREELARLAAGQPRHALTRALLLPRAGLADLPAAATALVDGISELVDGVRHPNREARFAAFDAAHGPLWELGNALCAPLDAAGTRHARLLGSRIEEAYALRDTRHFVASGAALLAQDSVTAMERATVGARGGDADWYAQVIAIDVAVCREALATGLATLPARRALRPLATLARIALATLDEVSADGCRVWERRVELTPVRKLWIALLERARV